MLDFINPAQILYALKERYKKNQIYTWVGAAKSVLIRWLKIPSGELNDIENSLQSLFLSVSAITCSAMISESPNSITHLHVTSINPYQMLPYYTPEVIDNHWHPPANKVLMPHTYDIAKRALLGMTLEGENQAILISGESGAGKTECAKQCFSFLAEVNSFP